MISWDIAYYYDYIIFFRYEKAHICLKNTMMKIFFFSLAWKHNLLRFFKLLYRDLFDELESETRGLDFLLYQ